MLNFSFRDWLLSEGKREDAAAALELAIEMARLKPTPSPREIADAVGRSIAWVSTYLKPSLTPEEYADVVYAGKKAGIAKRYDTHSGWGDTRADYEAKKREVIEIATTGSVMSLGEIAKLTEVPIKTVDNWLKAALPAERLAAMKVRGKEYTRERHRETWRVLSDEEEMALADEAFTTQISREDLAAKYGIHRDTVSRILNQYATDQDRTHRHQAFRANLSAIVKASYERRPFWDRFRDLTPERRLKQLMAMGSMRHQGNEQERMRYIYVMAHKAASMGIEVPLPGVEAADQQQPVAV